ncbi:hypothetical protein C465_01996 [Halorubrum distributum JCM 9100]|uniref:Uncharacterized protein n=2 Tax=Halorubrum distributum TaxID=29283 RepID=M0EZ43_9EURY|nr:hypothetical protein C465_01996 [Halorubrum distributum JCM 9100]ELZ58889.1 hypothetical protein C466_00410 [Halorubrum distributum JCM 10118]
MLHEGITVLADVVKRPIFTDRTSTRKVFKILDMSEFLPSETGDQVVPVTSTPDKRTRIETVHSAVEQ